MQWAVEEVGVQLRREGGTLPKEEGVKGEAVEGLEWELGLVPLGASLKKQKHFNNHITRSNQITVIIRCLILKTWFSFRIRFLIRLKHFALKIYLFFFISSLYTKEPKESLSSSSASSSSNHQHAAKHNTIISTVGKTLRGEGALTKGGLGG